MSAVLQAVEPPTACSSSEERVPEVLGRVLDETPDALSLVEQLADESSPAPTHDEVQRLACFVQDAAMGVRSPEFPLVQQAQLPTLYIAACRALEECERVDECREWQNKAAALASYARQARDPTFRVFAARIEARATRRCGQLLLAIAEQRGRRTDLEPAAASDTRLETAAAAGMSARQMHTALRVARLPEELFKANVESAAPPPITFLAKLGMVPSQSGRAALKPTRYAAWRISVLLRRVAAVAEQDAAVKAALEENGITTAMLRGEASAVRWWPPGRVQE